MFRRNVLLLSLILIIGFSLLSCGKAEEGNSILNPIVPYIGDINLNGRQCEIADAVMFTNFFVIGTDAFAGHVDSSVAASDVNGNGIRLELADLQYLVRYIQGDALPNDRLQAITDTCLVSLYGDEGTYVCAKDIGSMRLRYFVSGTSGGPTTQSDMDIISNVENDTLVVLLYNIGDEYLESGTHEFIDLNISGSVELIDAEAASYDGVNIPVVIQN